MRDARPSNDSLSSASAERRNFRRVPALRPVLYTSDKFGGTHSRILDLSEGGAYVESPVVPEGSVIEMEFRLVNGHIVRATAVVRYVVIGSGMGVEFDRIADKDREQIALFVSAFRAPVDMRTAHD